MKSPIVHHSQDYSTRSFITAKDFLSVSTGTTRNSPFSSRSFSKRLKTYGSGMTAWKSLKRRFVGLCPGDVPRAENNNITGN